MTGLLSRLDKTRALLTAVMACLILLAGAQPALAAEVKNINVVMILWRGETKAEKGFRERLEKEPGVNVRFTIFNPDGDAKALDDFLDGLKAGKFDFIYTHCEKHGQFRKQRDRSHKRGANGFRSESGENASQDTENHAGIQSI